jgi:hypothetical protein
MTEGDGAGFRPGAGFRGNERSLHFGRDDRGVVLGMTGVVQDERAETPSATIAGGTPTVVSWMSQ